MSQLVQEKVTQAISILNELNIDIWLTFVRETIAGGDPVLALIYGNDLTWQSALIISRTQEPIAVLGTFEAETARRIGAYPQIEPYDKSPRKVILDILEQISPNSIAINYSKDDVLADGLGVGLHQVLRDYLDGTPWLERLVSAEEIIRAVRGRKTNSEISRIKKAIETTNVIYERAFEYAKPGLTEKQVAGFMHQQLKEFGVTPAWEAGHCPTVNAGPESVIGHVGPTDIKIEAGHILHFDFGVLQDEYCSDIQRVMYFPKPGEKQIPQEVQRAFDTVLLATQKAVEAIRPGKRGVEIDTIARQVITDAGYPEFKHATGHQLGRLVHDGAGLLGPKWERYGETPDYLIEAGQVYTVEPGITVAGYGHIGLEEDILVTDTSAEYLSDPQIELIVKNNQ
jgi:Xaa-Pro aminopeptidase